MSKVDSNYSFYSHFEYLKNALYRQLSNARHQSMFLPSFYYAWFYTNERVSYNNLVKRQKLGLRITDEEVNDYNTSRGKISSFYCYNRNLYNIVKSKGKTNDGVEYDDISLQRKRLPYFPALVISVISISAFKLSRYWVLFSLLPIALIKYRDSKFAPKEEIESFYNFVSQRRDADALFDSQKKILSSFTDTEKVKILTSELQKSGKSLEEAINDLNITYLESAKSSLK